MLGGISDIAMKYGYSIKLFSAHENIVISDLLNDIVAEQVDGVLILNDELDLGQMKLSKEIFDNNDIPFVLANVVYDDKTVSVSIDYTKAGYEITKLMLEAGKKISICCQPLENILLMTLKEQGYTEAMEEAGLHQKYLEHLVIHLLTANISQISLVIKQLMERLVLEIQLPYHL